MSVVFSEEHKGMRVSASGILGPRNSKADKFMRQELLGHLKTVAKQYYAGNTAIVDEFLQLYCLADGHREGAVERQKGIPSLREALDKALMERDHYASQLGICGTMGRAKSECGCPDCGPCIADIGEEEAK
jgi:hypothetical protein